MKNKKLIIIISVIVIALLIVAVFLIMSKGKKENENNSENTAEIPRVPDIVIEKTEGDSIKLDGFEVSNIEIFTTSDISVDVEATLVNNSDKPVEGFFIDIGLFDENDKKITSIANNHEEEIKPKEKYIVKSSVVGEKNIGKIKKAKVLTLEKDTKRMITESMDEMVPEEEP